MKRITGIWLFAFLSAPSFIYGQGKTNMEEVKQILAELKNTEETSYTYSFKAQYPNGQKEHIQGEVYLNSPMKYMFNECEAFSMIYSNHWFYRADHRKKEISIVNMDKETNKELKAGVEKDVFENGTLINFIDSVVLKYATIKVFKKQKDTLRTELVFPGNMSVRNISIVYSSKNKILLAYNMSMYRPFQQSGNASKGILQNVSCTNFKRNSKKTKYRIDNFFTLSKDQVELKKYNQYKLSTKL